MAFLKIWLGQTNSEIDLAAFRDGSIKNCLSFLNFHAGEKAQLRQFKRIYLQKNGINF